MATFALNDESNFLRIFLIVIFLFKLIKI